MNSTPQTESQKRKRRNWSLTAGVILLAALAWVCMNVWTAPMGVIWHSFHGNFTSFEGHKIHVPWDMMVVRSSDQAITIIRLGSKYPIVRSPWGFIQIIRTRTPVTDISNYYDRIARTNELPPKGYRFQGLRQLSAPKGVVYCSELTRLDSSELSISCWFDKDTLAVSYAGSPVYSQEFYNAVETVSGATSPAKR